jgi:chemotaxis-related protein WspB
MAMLLLLFRLGSDRYGIDASAVVEVLPLVNVTPTARPTPGLAGILNYRGTFVPVVDLTQLLVGRAAQPRLSTRVVMASLAGSNGDHRLVGLIVENVTDTRRCSPADLLSPGIEPDEAGYLGPIARVPEGLIQVVELVRILPPSLVARQRGAA